MGNNDQFQKLKSQFDQTYGAYLETRAFAREIKAACTSLVRDLQLRTLRVLGEARDNALPVDMIYCYGIEEEEKKTIGLFLYKGRVKEAWKESIGNSLSADDEAVYVDGCPDFSEENGFGVYSHPRLLQILFDGHKGTVSVDRTERVGERRVERTPLIQNGAVSELKKDIEPVMEHVRRWVVSATDADFYRTIIQSPPAQLPGAAL